MNKKEEENKTNEQEEKKEEEYKVEYVGIKRKHQILCPRCRNLWTPRVERPKKCPMCKKELFERDKQVVVMMCPFCGHEWQPRTKKKPKECPSCKRYLVPRLEKKDRGRKLKFPIQIGDKIYTHDRQLPPIKKFNCPVCYEMGIRFLGDPNRKRRVGCLKCNSWFDSEDYEETDISKYELFMPAEAKVLHKKKFNLRFGEKESLQSEDVWMRWKLSDGEFDPNIEEKVAFKKAEKQVLFQYEFDKRKYGEEKAKEYVDDFYAKHEDGKLKDEGPDEWMIEQRKKSQIFPEDEEETEEEKMLKEREEMLTRVMKRKGAKTKKQLAKKLTQDESDDQTDEQEEE